MPINVNPPLEIVFNEKIPSSPLHTENEDSILSHHNHSQSNSEVWSLQFSPDGSILVWQSGQRELKLMKWKNSQDKRAYEPTSDPEETQHAKKLATAQFSSAISQNSLQQKLKILNNTPTNGATNEKYTAFNGDICKIDCNETIWSLAFGSTKSYVKHKRILHKPKTIAKVNTRFQLCQSDAYLILAVGLVTGMIKIYQVEANCEFKLLFNVYDHKGIVNDLKFTQDGSLLLASASRDETIKLWNMFDDGNLFKTLRSDAGRFYACDWSPTASLLCAVGSNRRAIIWNTETYNVT